MNNVDGIHKVYKIYRAYLYCYNYAYRYATLSHFDKIEPMTETNNFHP